MKKRMVYVLLGLLVPFCQVFANNSFDDHLATPTISDKVDNLENLLEGRVLGNALMVNFNISQIEFNGLLEQDDISKITIDFFWKRENGDSIAPVSSVVLDEMNYLFDIEGWTYQITPIDTNGYYLAQVAIGDAACGPRVEIPVIEDEIIEEEEDLTTVIDGDTIIVDPIAYECGDEVVDSLNSTVALNAASTGDLFLIGGFPLVVETLEPFTDGTGYYTGTGIIPLPFKKTAVRVRFNNIFVTEEYKVTQGMVVAESDDIANYPDFSVAVDTISVGGDICLPPPPPPGYTADGINKVTGLDDWGFDADGIHQNGTMYDDAGFDADGNYMGTDSPYNPQGCSREGVDGDGNACDPSAGNNPDAEAFADAIADDIDSKIDSVLNEILTDLQDSLAQFNCDPIRQEMETLVSTLEYDPLFIFGEGNKYLVEGMYNEFEKAPLPLLNNVERDADAQTLEEKHIDLYHCDKNAAELNAIITALNDLKTDEELAATFLEKIRNWTAYAYGLHSKDATAFVNWLSYELKNLLNEQSGVENGLTAIDSSQFPFQKQLNQYPGQWMAKNLSRYAVVTPKKGNRLNAKHIKDLFQYERGPSTHNTIASLDGASLYNESFTLEDASFEFRQGAEWINGVHRGYYLEGLARQQYFNPTPANGYLQPVKVENTVGNRTYTIYLDSMIFRPDGASLNAYAIIDDPETGKRLMFRGKNISFNPAGLQGESSLSLGTDIEIRLNNAALLIIKGTEGTNLTWDCDGFKSVSIDAAIELCREYIIPLNAGTLEPEPEPERYRVDVAIQDITGWLEFIFIVDSPKPFAVAGAEDIKWKLTNMVVDFSSTETPSFNPLEGYASPFYDKGNGMGPGWKGFYMENLEVIFPNDFSSSEELITTGASDVLIDECGFTGRVYVENLLNIDNGDVGGWPFSIDKFELSILKNGFGGAGLGGEINVPLFKENMDYTAVMFPNNQYKFTVSPTTDLSADVFLAKVELYEDSEINIGKVDGEFLAVATMSGNISVNGDSTENKGTKITFPQLCFEGFEVSNQAPYFSPGKWGIVGGGVDLSDVEVGAEFAGFGLTLSDIRPYSPADKEVGLGFNANISLVKALDINAFARLGLEGKLEETNGRQKWVFKDISVSGVAIDASFPGAEVKGLLEWYKGDATWGKGFRGVLDTKFKGFDLGLQAAAQFGSVNDYKYFFVDALADLGAGIGTGALQIKGFGGGVSYHMNAMQDDVNFFNTSGDFTLPQIGLSFSGTQYTPDKSIGLGLKAAVLVSTVREEIFNGTASLQFLFNEGNGLNKISLQGSGQFLNPIDLNNLPTSIEVPTGAATKPANYSSPALAAYMDLTMNFEEPSFHGNLNVFLNALNGKIAGTGAGGKLVDAELHFDPNKWYIHMGRPYDGQTAGIKFEIPKIGFINSESYLQIGTETDPMRPIPSRVAEIAYKINRNESLRTSGAGLVLGSSLGFKLDAKIAGVASATLETEAGFDVMLRKYNGVSCRGSNEPIGIDGWYANGQMYAYTYGRLKAFGINIAEAGIAAVLQARLPNPFFAQATVGVKLKVGPLKVKKSLKLQLGDDCTLVANDGNELGMEVISYLTPSPQEANVETNAQPAAFFGLQLNKTYELNGLNDSESSNYQARLLSTELLDGEGLPLSHSYVYNEDKTALRAIPKNTLPAKDSITFIVTVRIFKDGDFFQEETKSSTFATGDILSYIPEINVAAAYPANGMVNFYPNEYSRQEGYIKLVTGQSDLFQNLPEGTTQNIRLTAAGGGTALSDFSYDGAANQLTFPMPAGQLSLGTLYKLEVIQSTGGSSTSTSITDDIPTTDDNVAVSNESERVLYSLYFRVSDYATFAAKLAAISGSSSTDDEIILAATPEIFGALEAEGNSKYDALVGFNTDLSNSWIQQDIKNHFEALESLIYCSTNYPSLADLSASVSFNNGRGGFTSIDANTFGNGAFNAHRQQYISFELEKLVKTFSDIRKELILECGGGSTGALVADCADSGGSDADCANFVAQSQADYAPLPVNSTFKVQVSYTLPGGPTTTIRELTFTKTNTTGTD